jgi:hypothetical protein
MPHHLLEQDGAAALGITVFKVEWRACMLPYRDAGCRPVPGW